MHQIKPCPECSETAGWVEKWVVCYGQVYTPKGEPDTQTEYSVLDSTLATKKRKYCARCEYPITALIKKDKYDA